MSNINYIENLECDVLIVGSGGTGSQATQAAAEEGLDVIVITKDPLSSSDTKICEGVMTVRASGDEADTEKVLSENIKLAGADLPDRKITTAFANDSKIAYDRLRSNGLRPSINKINNKPKTLAIAMGGHNKSRSVGHKNSGIAFGHTNWDTIIKYTNVRYFEDSWFLEVVKEEATTNEDHALNVLGGIVYDAARGKLLFIKSSSVVIASGGLSTLFFPKTDTMRGNTGDSYALAIRAGADLLDMEQIQFLPFCLASPPSYEGLLAGEPSTASFLGVLKDKNNKVILDSVYLRTRAECSEAIMRAVEDGRGSPNGGAYLDMTKNKSAPRSGKYFMKYLQSALPSAYNNARQALGKKAGKAEIPWEVRPGAHYSMGGIRVDENARVYQSNKNFNNPKVIKGLFAAGQAMGGLFGANRLGSTSLTELAVFGYRAGKSAAENAKNFKVKTDEGLFHKHYNYYKKMFNRKGKLKVYKLKLELQKKCWDNIGPARTENKLKKMLIYLNKLELQLDKVNISEDKVWNQQFIDLVELKNMTDTAKAVTLASLKRDRSVGGHVRLDKKTSSLLSKPYSTLVKINKENNYEAFKLNRERTPLKRILVYKLSEKFRLMKARALRYLPENLSDIIIEQKYKKLFTKPLKIDPGSTSAAPGENLNEM
jgi:fumarate reductase (CoM/CoB) subunit A